MKKYTYWIALLGITACLLTIIVGCGRGPVINKVVLVLAHTESTSPGKEFVSQMIDLFMKDNPDVEVENLLIPSASYDQKVLTMMAAGTPPDVFESYINRRSEHLRKGACLNLTPYLERDKEIKVSDFFEETIPTYRYDGEVLGKGPIYGLPKDWSMMLLYYNKDLFDIAGIKYPDSTWKWSDMIESSRVLAKRDEADRLLQAGTLPPDYFGLIPFIYQNGGKVWSEDMKKCLLDEPESLEVFEYFFNAYYNYKSGPTFAESKDRNMDDMFYMGKVAMRLHWRFFTPIVDKYVGNKFRWGVAPLPSKDGKNRVNCTYSPTGWAISSKTKYPEEAYQLLKAFTGKEGQMQTAKLGWNIPAMKEVSFSDAFLFNKNHPEGVNQVCIDEIQYCRAEQVSSYLSYDKFLQILNDECTLVHLGKKTVTEAVKEAVKSINMEIEKNLSNNKW